MVLSHSNASLWFYMSAMDISANDWVRSNMSTSVSNEAVKQAKPSAFGCDVAPFRMFMGTILFLFSLLGWIISWPQRAGVVVQAVAKIIEQFVAHLPDDFTMTLSTCGKFRIHGGTCPISVVYVLFGLLDLGPANWYGMGVQVPRLTRNPNDCVPFQLVLFMLLRASRTSISVMNVAREWVHELAAMLDRSEFGGRLAVQISAADFPRDIILSTGAKQLARGDDKKVMLYNRFLCRHSGFNATLEDLLFKDMFLACFLRFCSIVLFFVLVLYKSYFSNQRGCVSFEIIPLGCRFDLHL